MRPAKIFSNRLSSTCLPNPNHYYGRQRRAGRRGRSRMMSGGRNEPMLKAVGLWAKTSVKGGWYLTGRLGGVKVAQ
jgi:hypothetical protein